jgi:glycosyltransferase involved in cell wall biosynthesis
MLHADIELVGYQCGIELHDLIRRARAVVLPSEWYENAPLSLLESYALGKPVIGARIGGIPEMLIDGETGWSFTSGDALDLADLLKRVAAMPNASLSAKGKNARRFVEKQFNRKTYTHALLSLYSEFGIR